MLLSDFRSAPAMCSNGPGCGRPSGRKQDRILHRRSDFRRLSAAEAPCRSSGAAGHRDGMSVPASRWGRVYGRSSGIQFLSSMRPASSIRKRGSSKIELPFFLKVFAELLGKSDRFWPLPLQLLQFSHRIGEAADTVDQSARDRRLTVKDRADVVCHLVGAHHAAVELLAVGL